MNDNNCQGTNQTLQLEEIATVPTCINKTHESCFRAYHILNKVLEMMERGDSKQTIKDTVRFLRDAPEPTPEP